MTALLLIGLLYGVPRDWDEGIDQPCSSNIPGPAHLILVGRNEPPPEFGDRPLRYTTNDVRAMYRAGLRLMCFRRDQITVLVGERATPKAVLAHVSRHQNLARLFVYISAHGKQRPDNDGYSIGLARPLQSNALRAAVEAAKARQTFVFLDTCNAARSLPAKGAVRPDYAAEQTPPGSFWLAAAMGVTYEQPRWRAGMVTADFLRIIRQFSPMDSTELCRQLDLDRIFSGMCREQLKTPVEIAPAVIRRGVLRVAEPADWSYVVFDGHSGIPLTNLRNDEHFTARMIELPPGQYTVRRTRDVPIRCERAKAVVVAGRTLTLSDVDWVTDGANCDHILSNEPDVRRPMWSLWLSGSWNGSWVPRSGSELGFRLGGQWQPGERRYGLYLFGGRTLRADRDVHTAERISVQEIGLAAAIDPVMTRVSRFDMYAGLEVGGALTRAALDGQSGIAAVRLGGVIRLNDSIQPEFVGQLGVRVFRQVQSAGIGTVPWAGIMIGASFAGWR